MNLFAGKYEILMIKSQLVETRHAASLQKPKPGSLSAIIRFYKSAVTRWSRQNGHPSFTWQARFYDHIIRNDKYLPEIRNYIIDNPLKWELGRENPKNMLGEKL